MSSAGRMHADEVATDAALVQRLLAAQLPHWAGLSVTPVPSAGTDHALYRLGDDKLVRLPRVHWAVAQVEKEHTWLPELAPALPLAVPAPLAKGRAGEGYPWPWSVYAWLEGESVVFERLTDPVQSARALAGFVRALQCIDPTGGPAAGAHNFFRGLPLAQRDEPTRAALIALEGRIDTRPARAAWEAALCAPPWSGAARWIHGDLAPGNLLARDGRLSAVIDFGGLGVGDPACDLMPAWSLFRGASREAYRVGLELDSAAWARGRGWALSVSLVALPYYWATNPALVASARHTLDAVLADV